MGLYFFIINHSIYNLKWIKNIMKNHFFNDFKTYSTNNVKRRLIDSFSLK